MEFLIKVDFSIGSRLNETNEKLGAKVANTEMEAKLQESEAIPLLHERDRIKTEMESLQTHANWLQGELEAKTSSYQRLQHEAHDRQLQLQLQLQQTENEKDAAQVREEELRKIEGRLQTQVEQLSRDVMEAKKELADVKESSALQIQEERQFVNSQKEHLIRWEQRYNHAVRESEALKEAAGKVQASIDEQLDQARKEVETKYEELIRIQASELESRIEQRESVLPIAAQQTQTGDDDDAPVGLTEVYELLEKAKSDLRKETLRANRAELEKRRIMEEVAERTPRLNRQREEYEIAMDQMTEYQSRLDDALRVKDEARADSDEARRAATKWRKQYDEKVAEAKLLASQVQTLLVSRAGGTSETNVPLSVTNMQQQNQRLLVSNENLRKEVEELKERLNEDELASKLEESQAEIEALRDQRKLQLDAVEKIAQQRDLYKSLCNLESKSSHGQELTVQEFSKEQVERVKKLEKELADADEKLATVTSERDFLTREKEASEERLARYESYNGDLTKSLSRLESDLQVARGDLARGQSEAKYHSEKCVRLEESVHRGREELVHVTSAKNELQRINAELQHSLTESRSLVAQKETAKLQAETQLRLAETQAETARLAQKRATEEATHLRTEVARQGTLIDSIRRIENSLTAKNESETETLKEELDEVKKTMAHDRKRYQSELDNLRERAKSAESRCLEAEAEKAKVQAEAKVLQDSTRAKAAPVSTGPGNDDEVSAQEKIDSLTTQLAAANTEIAGLKENVENYKKAAKVSESSMAEVSSVATSKTIALKEELERVTKECERVKKESTEKQGIIVEMTESLKGQREVQEKAEAELQVQISSLKSKLETREKDLESSQASFSALQLDLDTMRSEMSKVQSNFEHELRLHSEARSELIKVREESDKAVIERDNASKQIEELKSSHTHERDVSKEEKESMKQEILVLEQNLKGTRDQNKVLHSQLETLGNQVQEHLASRTGTSEADNTTISEDQKVLSELREIVKFVRSENQMIQTQLDTATRGLEREKAAASVLRQTLDEARSELSTLTKKWETNESSMVELTGLKGKLRSADEQLALLGDSNKLLREECERTRASLKVSETEKESLRKQLQPAENFKHESDTKIASLAAENESLRRELEAWKGRVDNLVKKFNQVDPAEHSKALAKVDELMKEKLNSDKWKDTMDSENKRIREIAKKLNLKQKELKSQLDERTKEIEKLKSERESLVGTSAKEAATAKERDELKEKLVALEKKTSSVETELEGANKRNENLRERLRQFQMTIRDLKSKEQILTQKLAAAQSERSVTDQPTAAVKKQKAEPVDAVQDPTSEEKLKDSDKNTTVDSKVRENPAVVPSVPDGGFSFGPSPELVEKSAHNQKTCNENEGAVQSSLKADAAVFVPKDKPEAVANKPPARPTVKRQASGETMELSAKEKLMKKKRKLAEALSKLEAKKAPEKSEGQGEADGPPASTQTEKVESKENVQIETEPAKPKDDSKPVDTAISSEKTEASEGKVPEAVSGSLDGDVGKAKTSGDEAEEMKTESVANETTADGDKPVESGTVPMDENVTPSLTTIASGANPFASRNPFASVAPPKFPEPSAAAATGSASGGFLNMKPPDSSSSPPSFNFGTSSITLPMPSSAAPPPSPFDTFAGGSKFGGTPSVFGDTSQSIVQPLFGSSATQPESTQEDGANKASEQS